MDLRAGVFVVGGGVEFVGELIDVDAVGRLLGEAGGDVLVVLGVALLDVGAGEDDLGAMARRCWILPSLILSGTTTSM